MSTIYPQWQSLLNREAKKQYFTELQRNIANKRQQGDVIFPQHNEVFSAFTYGDLTEVKVVILGQDPYHGTGSNNQPQAHGLAFSVNPEIKIPPSLVNIFKELATDIDDFIIPNHGNLVSWAKQGVLLLNTVLTVEQGKAHSHAKLGWEQFTDVVIEELSRKNSGCVFMLWGSHAQKKGQRIDNNKHGILMGPHPSPLSAYRGFFGCQHFSQANDWLLSHNKTPIDWRLPNINSDIQPLLL